MLLFASSVTRTRYTNADKGNPVGPIDFLSERVGASGGGVGRGRQLPCVQPWVPRAHGVVVVSFPSMTLTGTNQTVTAIAVLTPDDETAQGWLESQRRREQLRGRKRPRAFGPDPRLAHRRPTAPQLLNADELRDLPNRRLRELKRDSDVAAQRTRHVLAHDTASPRRLAVGRGDPPCLQAPGRATGLQLSRAARRSHQPSRSVPETRAAASGRTRNRRETRSGGWYLALQGQGHPDPTTHTRRAPATRSPSA